MARFCLVLLAGLCAAAPTHAASWADGLFQELSKDFGSVPRGPMLEHAFTLQNNTGEVVRISALRVSCGCLTATVAKSVLRPGEETAVVAHMDTTRFVGVKTVTIYVHIDQPRTEEVRLWVRANARDDVSVSPETLTFGQIQRGDTSAASVTVTFLGSGDARIVQAFCGSNYVQPDIEELRRGANVVAYRVTARLRGDAPVGKWFTDVWLRTSNAAYPSVRVPLTVEIESALSITPQGVRLGEVKVGGESERKIIVRGVKPFKITGVRGADDVLSVRDGTNTSKPVHVLTVRLKPDKPGAFDRLLEIQTDLGGSSIEFRASATVTP